jgi:hyperosmotically inducible protein
MDRLFRLQRRPSAAAPLAALCGLAAGAALMYFLDPDSGRRRRALVREKSARYAREARERQAALLRHASNRAHGAMAAIRDRAHSEEIVDDAILLERVRAALGHVVGDPLAVDIRVRCGTVILKGPAREDQVDELITCARNVRGVLDVENRLALSGEPGM